MFQAGNKLGGRTTGAKNKITYEIKEAFTLLVKNNIQGLDADLKQLQPKDRVKLIIELSKYLLPTLKSVEAEVKTSTDVNWLDQYTEDELQILLKAQK